jgi:Subtilase family
MNRLLLATIFLLMSNMVQAQEKYGTESRYLYESFQLYPNKKPIPNAAAEAVVHTYNKNNPYYILKLKAATGNDFKTLPKEVELIRELDNGYCISFLTSPEAVKSVTAVTDFIAPANNLWKLSPHLFTQNDNHKEKINTDNKVLLQFRKKTGDYTQLREAGINIVSANEETDMVTVLLPNTISITDLSAWEDVIFIDARPKAMEETVLNGFDLSTNKINAAHRYFPNVNGFGLTLSVKENMFDSSDIDFTGRFLPTTVSSPILNGHATNMATIAGGGGNSFFNAKGAAWGCRLSSSSFANTLPDNTSIYQQYNISVQNHSYGTGIENYYGGDALAYDQSVNSINTLLHVYSAGNAGTQNGSGNYTGVQGFANLTGNFKMSKNLLVVGATDSLSNIEGLSSRGPAYDGRVKPELVAFGESGSSGAAAVVSGTALLLQQLYQQQHGGSLPPSALVKAILLNSADDAGTAGIDYTSGYGSLNAYRAMLNMQAGRFVSGNLANGGIQNFTITIPANVRQLKATLVWNDPAATVNAPKALVNDLDLELSLPAAAQSWKPWVLSSFPNKDSLQLLPVRKKDNLNNIEQVTIDSPAAGTYTLKVSGFSIPAGSQDFYIAYQWDTLNSFRFTFPAQTDNMIAGAQSIIRWESSYTATTGKLEFSKDGGQNWITLQQNSNLAKGSFNVSVPDTLSLGLCRMTIGSDRYLSDTFTISKALNTVVGFNCNDSFLLYWNKATTGNYILYQLGNTYAQPIGNTTDTFRVLSKAGFPALYYAVAPVIAPARNGLRSFLFNYTTQGVACYIKNFLADITPDNTATINAALGSLYRIKNIYLEKSGNTGFGVIKTIANPVLTEYNFTDLNLQKGANSYRLKIELLDGRFIYSDIATVYSFGTGNYLLFPNPVQRNQVLKLYSKDILNTQFVLFDPSGRKLIEKNIDDYTISINIAGLGKGVYYYFILKDGKRDAKGSLMVQ